MATYLNNNNTTIELTFFFRQLWHLVDVLTGVMRVGHAETKVKIKRLEQLLSEIVPLYHPELFHWLISHCEFNPGGGTVCMLIIMGTSGY